MRIVIIGSGNVATVLGRKIIEAKHEVLQVYSRDTTHAAQLAKEIGSAYTNEIQKLDTTGDAYLLAIPDASLYRVSEWLVLNDQLVMHTAGSVSKDLLQEVSANYGVLYPLQSLRKELVQIPEIPFLVDGNNETTKSALFSFANTIGTNIAFADDQSREKIHLAAVITSNFTNHLFAMAQEYCRSEKVDFNKLLPLITEVSRRIADRSAAELQTGPAMRDDEVTLARHRQLLAGYPQLRKFYDLFSAGIRKMYPQKNNN
jgi:predicted short-subunit dehydrogenase-like oxidoreductase (DUF2520 family)